MILLPVKMLSEKICLCLCRNGQAMLVTPFCLYLASAGETLDDVGGTSECMASATFSTSDHIWPSLIMVVSVAVGTAKGLTTECVFKSSSRSLSMCRLGLRIAVHVW